MSQLIKTYPHRFIGHYVNGRKGPTVVVLGGIHGNEDAGVKALETICQYIEKEQLQLNCNFYAVKGNLKALSRDKRFIDHDLNRLWTEDTVEAIINAEFEDFADRSDGS